MDKLHVMILATEENLDRIIKEGPPLPPNPLKTYGGMEDLSKDIINSEEECFWSNIRDLSPNFFLYAFVGFQEFSPHVENGARNEIEKIKHYITLLKEKLEHATDLSVNLIDAAMAIK